MGVWEETDDTVEEFFGEGEESKGHGLMSIWIEIDECVGSAGRCVSPCD